MQNSPPDPLDRLNLNLRGGRVLHLKLLAKNKEQWRVLFDQEFRI